MSSDDLARGVLGFLRRRGDPASSLLIADRFLHLRSPSEEIATRILTPLLGSAGLVYEPGAGWRPPPPAQASSAEAPAAPRVACAVGLAPSGAIRSACFIGIAADGAPPSPAGGGPRRIDRLDWPAISALLDGTEAIFAAPEAEAPPLLAELSRRGLPRPASIRSLGSAAREAVRLPRGATVETICETLGCGYRDGDSAADAAANVAACLEAARGLAAASHAPDLAATIEPCGEGRPAPRALTPRFLSSVPARPGVYRFYARDGRLLYVGKAADLRRRLTSHAAAPVEAPARAARPARLQEALARLHRVEYEVLGSDLEARLREARVIARRSPGANVQREVHERGRRYAPGRMHAILLPAKEPGAVSVVFIRDGRYEGSCRIGPKGGGARAASRILARLLRPRGTATGRPGIATGRRVDADTEILNSWLARHGESAHRVDLDSARGPADALRALMEARTDLHDPSGGTVLRRSGLPEGGPPRRSAS